MAFIGNMLGAGKGSDFVAAGNPDKTVNPVTIDQVNQSYQNTQQGLGSQQALMNALQSQQAQGIQNQTQLGGQLAQQAQGLGPNPAQAQLAQNTQQNIASQGALMAGQRGAGANAGMLARQAAMQGANIQQNAVGQAATLGAQQQLAAQQQMGALAGNQIGQSMGAVTGYNQAAQGQQQNLLGAQSAYNNAQAGILANVNQTNSATQIQNSKAQQGIFGGLLGGAGGILSDENAKTDIHSADDKIRAFLDNIGSHEYKYKDSVQGDPGTAPGMHTGPMAQELEGSELGKQMVVNTPDGKGVDFQRGMGTIIAAQAMLNKRLDALEGGKKMSQGGEVKGYADGGSIAPMQSLAPATAPIGNYMPQGPQSSVGKFLSGMGEPMQQQQQPQMDMGGGGNPMQEGLSKFIKGANERFGSAPEAPVSPSMAPADYEGSSMAGVQSGSSLDAANAPIDMGEGLSASEGASAMGSAEGAAGAAEATEGTDALLLALSKGGSVGSKLKAGGHVPGKAKVKGDSEKNDTVVAKLSPGEVVIPRSVMSSKNPADGAARFVAALMAKKGKK